MPSPFILSLTLVLALLGAGGEQTGPELSEGDAARVAELLEAGLALHEAGRPLEALDVLRRAEAVAPEQVAVQVNIGLLLAELDQLEAAQRALARARDRAPQDAAIRCHLAGVLQRLKRHQAAWQELAQALKLAPDSPLVRFQLGVSFADAGILGEAAREWERVLAAAGEEDPLAAQARANLQRIDRLLGVLTPPGGSASLRDHCK